MKVLHAVNDIRNAVSEVLGDVASARYAIVAFIGRDPLRWITEPRGLQVYCWPRAGGTNPDGIDALVNAGATVHFKEFLHSKVYHSETRGTVIGSANLSDNALGTGRLTETVVHLPPGAFSLDEQMKTLEGAVTSGTPQFVALMDKLRREHVAYYQRNPDNGKGSAKGAKRQTGNTAVTFGDWFEQPEGSRAPWQLGLWTGQFEPPQDVLEEYQESGGKAFSNWRAHHHRKNLEIGVATIDCSYKTKEWGIRKKNPFWWYPQFQRTTHQPELIEHENVWFANVNVPDNVSVPFDCKEPKFLEALDSAVVHFAEATETMNGRVKGKFLKFLVERYHTLA